MLLLIIPVFLSVFLSGSTAQESSASEVMSELIWKHRVIILFGPEEELQENQQLAFFRSKAQFRDRDMTLIRVKENAVSRDDNRIGDSRLAASFSKLYEYSEGFLLVLVGKDGTVKRRENEPVDASKIYDQIDSMPMRKREMRE